MSYFSCAKFGNLHRISCEEPELSTPQGNYGMRGQLFLFQNPIMKLKPEQQEICRLDFEAVKGWLKQTEHRFRHDALMNAVECMIIDFFIITKVHPGIGPVP